MSQKFVTKDQPFIHLSELGHQRRLIFVPFLQFVTMTVVTMMTHLLLIFVLHPELLVRALVHQRLQVGRVQQG